MQATNWFLAGGIVMFPLLGFSILAVALIFERVLFWVKVTKRHDRMIREVLMLYKRSPRAAFWH